MKTNWVKPSPSIRLIMDAVLYGGFIALFFLELTGVGLHQWLGLAGAALALYHLIVHWDWVTSVTERFFVRLPWQARLYYLVDMPLLAGFALMVLSGLAICTWFDLPLSAGWTTFHITISKISLGLIVFKIAIHWRWIVRAVQRMVNLPAARSAAPARPQVLQQVHGAQRAAPVMSRRDFIKLMGVTGAAAAFAMLQVSFSLPAESAAAQVSSTSSTETTTNASSSSSLSSQSDVYASSSTSACITSCHKGRACSFPGHCREYVDQDNNGYCDKGECA